MARSRRWLVPRRDATERGRTPSVGALRPPRRSQASGWCRRGSSPWLPRAAGGSALERQERLVDFDRAVQQVTVWPNHGPPKSVQQGPRSLVAVQAKHALQPQGADALLLTGEVPRCSEPHSKGRAGLVEEGARRHAALMAARSADQSAPGGASGRIHHPACRTAKPVGPPQLLQVRRARFVACKPVLELTPRSRVVPTRNRLDVVHSSIVNAVELNG